MVVFIGIRSHKILSLRRYDDARVERKQREERIDGLFFQSFYNYFFFSGVHFFFQLSFRVHSFALSFCILSLIFEIPFYRIIFILTYFIAS